MPGKGDDRKMVPAIVVREVEKTGKLENPRKKDSAGGSWLPAFVHSRRAVAVAVFAVPGTESRRSRVSSPGDQYLDKNRPDSDPTG